MRKKLNHLKEYRIWLFVILLIEGFSGVLLWIADVTIFQSLFVLWILATSILFVVICCVLINLESKREDALKAFLSNPEKHNEKDLIDVYGNSKRESIAYMIETIYKKQAEVEKTGSLLSDYEDYVEMWAHETKLPLSLLTLILDNQGDSLPKDITFKLEYVRNQVQSHISQILFYYRIRSEKRDYLFEEFDIEDCVSAVLKDYQPLLDEKCFKIRLENLNKTIYTDRRSFEFIIGQIIGNSIKYSCNEPELQVSVKAEKNKTKVVCRDNGQGVKACDLPHIFEKGFTGDSGDFRKKSTGMGLYLVKQLVDDLKIDLQIKTDWMNGFEIALSV